MNKNLRLILFLTFLLTFLISAPLVVLYTAGYRLDLGAGQIVHTGVLNVTSVPRGATVFIDGVEQSEQTPSVFDTVYPGERVIRLEKDGYISWEKQLTVTSRETTFIEGALLFLESEKQVEDDRSTQHSSVSPDHHSLAYLVREGSWVELWVSDGLAETERVIARLPDEPGAEYTIEWSALGTYLILNQDGFTQESLTLVDLDKEQTLDIHRILKLSSEYWWDAWEDDVLYARLDGVIYQLNIHNTEDAEPLAFDAQTTSYQHQLLALSQNTDRAVLSTYENDTASIVTYLPYGTYQFHNTPGDTALLEDVDRQRIILVDLTNADQPILLNEQATSWHWSADQDRLVFTDGFDLEVYTRSTHTTTTLTRLSERIQDVFWYPLGNSVVFVTDAQVISIELDSRDGHETLELTGGVVGRAWVDPDGEWIYMLGADGNEMGIFSKRIQR
ncbi:PEGA domain-containing protein [Candidatus Uhrbacteria bacterium]|nr:PEGA domain-containing protein [Candidatus Uhrbacteria bacterium]